jgi:hypothetical protein
MLVPKTSYRCSNGYVYTVLWVVPESNLYKLLTFCSGQFHRQNHDRSAVPLSNHQQSPSSYQELACKTCIVLMVTEIILCLALSEHANPFIHARLSQNTVNVQCWESTEFPHFLCLQPTQTESSHTLLFGACGKHSISVDASSSASQQDGKVKQVTTKQQEASVLTDACTFSSRAKFKRKHEYPVHTF